ncbi:MAG: M23 family metallopeptidase [Solirubrobacterales bacterium]
MSRIPRIPKLLVAAIAACAIVPAAALASGPTGGVATDPGDTTAGNPGTGTGGSADAVFPVRARHTYGDGLGAGRGHQGVDLLAKCGKKVVAAESGRVRLVKYQSAAGNYVVVKARGSDEVYMHLAKPSKLSRGDRVRAGDLIGRVGQTGRATACHLHFEMWSKPGWYRGGSVMNPLPYLKQWDKKS